MGEALSLIAKNAWAEKEKEFVVSFTINYMAKIEKKDKYVLTINVVRSNGHAGR